MTGLIRRFRTLPLRSRLALLVATAVAVAVAAVAVVSWLLTRQQLYEELNTTLRNSRASDTLVEQAYEACAENRPASKSSTGFAYTQIVAPDGTRCVAPYSTPVKVRNSDVGVARGVLDSTLHNSVTDDGTPVRVHTTRMLLGPDGPAVAVSVSRPLDEITTALNRLALLLTGLAGVGVLGAGAAGLWVARAGLKPVDRLTEAVEHVARTEDLTMRIPIEGEDEIARLSRSFNSMTAALASSRDRQARLIADAGHELRTPLTSLRTNVELLARSERTGRAIPPEDRSALLDSLRAQTAELASLIGDLQELSRPDAAQGGPLTVVALHEITATALDRARLRGPGLTFTTDIGPWYVRAEPAALERALVNVLDNAVKFSPPGSTVEVRLRNGTLTVRDHGPGIPPEELPHVFERFWRSPSARALPGSGLGLSIVARTVQQAGGEIRLESPGDGGTRAVLRLPGAAVPPPFTAAG
ncbi:HAMP domain-containing sensor histidine kinase [Streptomyces clavuligerus]|uniref:histidine kinase n=1 Tax=Streptomyces clavuligerus TaxID=1901 RepID=B5GP66_STRCL|nr:HAMP domain-containing sensor histidine kinase [Streptomyces clavuligerus]ANW19027.1 two-component sensor histidine kinase [Streptomyces clavuligerus]AXU13608.1 sensor histidine kinase [Streptomyces clavuligerus]EDY48112.1 two-component system sensor [Streptomyces clavuligerus]EFG08253.1 putative two-component system sensor kinase [Streptomyces clavuligerus]MBY6303571.1 HAMP domain-containing histidine kinase [Streptomyces clavuligerus]